MLLETDLVPYHVSYPAGKRALILAPHPDDETLGCGGTIRLLVSTKKEVKVVFLTSGDKADPADKLSHKNSRRPSSPEDSSGSSDMTHISDYALMREREAKEALNVLGVHDYEFLEFPDRRLFENFQDVFERLSGIVREYLPDAVYCPSMIELNPDHRTASELAIRLQKTMEESVIFSIIFYEVTMPIRPNMLVDITKVYGKKMEALKKYRSQLKVMNYSGHIGALNKVRTLTVNPVRRRWSLFSSGKPGICEYAEAFWLVDRPLPDEDIIKWMAFRKGINAK